MAQPPIPVRYSTRALGMGGAMLLSAGPIEAGYFNPGALTQNTGLHIYVPMLQIAGDEDFFNLAKFIKNNSSKFSTSGYNALTNPERNLFLADLNKYVNKWHAFTLDPMIGLQIGSLSVSAYSVARMSFVADAQGTPAAPPSIKAHLYSDLVVNGALGMQFGPFLHGGVGVRYLRRNRTDPANPITISSDDMEGVDNLAKSVWDKENFFGDPITGFQVDVGGMLTLTRAFAVGGVIRGLLSSMDDVENDPAFAEEYKIKPVISGGVRVKPLELMMGIPLVIIRDITIEADIQNLTNVGGEEFVEKIQLGAEVKLPIVALRAGLDRGQLSLGAGIHFFVVDLSVAVSTIPDITPDGVVDKRYFTAAIGIGW